MEKDPLLRELNQNTVLPSELEPTENEVMLGMMDDLLGRKVIKRKSTNRNVNSENCVV